jgi:hypothetical protein
MFSASTPGAENPSGVADIAEESAYMFKLYPNPSNGTEIESTLHGSYGVYDIQGRLIASYFNTRKISVGELQSGVYLIVNAFGRTERFVKL